MDLLAVLLTGLFAGGISCAAVQGGLLAGLITRQRGDAPAASSFGDDLAPVGGFLLGKLVSHTLLGALLGALGGVVQLSVTARVVLQIAAGVLVVVFGLAQLRVPGFRRVTVVPPRALMRLVRRRSKSQAALAPGLLGIATVLIPCGVTLSVEALALASGSAPAGAAVMAVFVIGTSPLFAVLGYAARKAAMAWRGRMGLATGVVLVLVGLFTVNGGLEVGGSPLALSRVAASMGIGTEPADTSTVSIVDGEQLVEIVATKGSYRPSNVLARSGVRTTLVVRSEKATGCVRSLIIPSKDVDRVLPINGETRIDLGVLSAGRIDYSCGMGMYTGVITVD